MLGKRFSPAITALTLSLVLTFLEKHGLALELGQLQCTESGVFPDEKLIAMVMQKCQPKLDDPKDLLVACVTKCILRHMKAVTKKGKLKKTEALELAAVLPDGFQESGKEKFNECYEEHHTKIKKESKCDSWVPFSSCFIGFAETLCKTATTTPSE